MPAHIRRNPPSCPRKSKKRNDATGYLFTLFLTHVGNLNTVRLNQRRFAPTPARITGIRCPLHRNTQLQRADRNGSLESHFNPPLTPEERETAAVEGWILGVV